MPFGPRSGVALEICDADACRRKERVDADGALDRTNAVRNTFRHHGDGVLADDAQVVCQPDLGPAARDDDRLIVRVRVQRDAVATRDLLEHDEQVRHVWGVDADRIDDHRPAGVRAMIVWVADHRHELRSLDDAHGSVMVGRQMDWRRLGR